MPLAAGSTPRPGRRRGVGAKGPPLPHRGGRHRPHRDGRLAPGEPLAAAARGIGHTNLVTQTHDELEDTLSPSASWWPKGPNGDGLVQLRGSRCAPGPPGPGHVGPPSTSTWATLEAVLLRTHTSPVQSRLMEAHKLPIYAVMPGQVLPQETLPDAAPSAGLPSDRRAGGGRRGSRSAILAGLIESFTTAFLGPDIRCRCARRTFLHRPSAEFEVTCPICGGERLRTCSGSGWIELGAAAMVNPNVFDAVGIDPESTPASPSASASTAWPRSGLSCPTCGSCSTTTSVSSPSSRS